MKKITIEIMVPDGTPPPLGQPNFYQTFQDLCSLLPYHVMVKSAVIEDNNIDSTVPSYYGDRYLRNY